MGSARAFSNKYLPKNIFDKRNLRGCTSRKRDNIVLIEVDSDDFGDVIILDVPESFQTKFRKKPKHVISIDDDDDDDVQSRDEVHTDRDATTSNIGCPTEAAHPSTSAYVKEDGLFYCEGNTPVKLSKSKRTYSGKSISRNRYGLGLDSEDYSSESDCSDCELMEGSLGKLREQWEKASYRRRNDASSVSPDFENEASTSATIHPVHENAEECTAAGGGSSGQEKNVRNCSLHHDGDDIFADIPPNFCGGSKKCEQDNDPTELDGHFTCTRGHLVHDNAEGAAKDAEPPGQQKNLRNFFPHHDVDNVLSGSPQKFSEGSRVLDQEFDFVEEIGKPTSTHDDFLASGCNEKEGSGTSAPEFPVNHNAEQCTHKSVESTYDISDLAEQNKFSQHYCDHKTTNEAFNGDYSADVTKGLSHDIKSDHTTLCKGHKGAGMLSTPFDDKSSHGVEIEAASSTDQTNIITDREKIKETEEYKHAMEEEWAARQQQLMRQAEEAQRLKIKKKAEKLRLMMNEKRQKQRLEEVRQTRKKDEENLNVKERHRIEIKKELSRIEAICGDMASLLRCLGIQVGGGLFPSRNEVQAAYKRACLKFHPDRISATDLRQQVEAEEKFKLISNMKEKLSK